MEITEQEKLIKNFENDPVAFIEVFLDRELSKKQKLFLEHTKTKKHIVNIWSRQTGKSTVTASYIVWRLLYGKGCTVNNEHLNEQIAIVAPIKEQHVLIFDKMATLINKSEFIKSFVVKMNTEKIVMKNGNFCKFMSASPGSQIRGFTATCIIIDESQDITDAKYSGDILPFGATTDALVLESGTPKTKNHFYNAMHSKSVIVVKQLWFECPFLSEDYVMAQKAISPDALWRQEYLCEFMEEGVLAFPSRLFEPEAKDGVPTGRKILDDYKYHTDYKKFTREEAQKIVDLVNDGAEYVAGLDLGKKNDHAELTIWRKDVLPIRLAVHITFPLETKYEKIAAIVGMYYKVFQWQELNFDYTNEKSFLEMLQSEDVPAYEDKKKLRSAIAFSQKNKAEMVNTAVILLERYQIQLPAGADKMLQQFLNQQYEEDDYGKKKFYHPSNENDDILWSSLLALKNIVIFVQKDKMTFVNPWEKQDEKVAPNRKQAKEVVFSTRKMRMDNRAGYVPAEMRRSRRY